MSIYGTYGCLWTLARLGRNLGYRPRDHKYWIHHRRGSCGTIWTLKESRQNTSRIEFLRMAQLPPLPGRIIDMVCGDRIFPLDDHLTDGRSL